MSERTPITLAVEKWAEIVVDKWVKLAAHLKIHPDSPITHERFYHYVHTQADGNPQKVEFAFDYYLKFVNLGVGRGVNMENRDTYIAANKRSKAYEKKNKEGRRPKPWYDDVFYKELYKLGAILAESYAHFAVSVIKNSLDNAERHKKSWTNVDSEGPIQNMTGSTPTIRERSPKIVPGKEGYSVKDYKRVRYK